MSSLAYQCFASPQGCRAWLLFDEASGEAVVVDPHLDQAEAIRRTVAGRGLRFLGALDTHVHADHPSAARVLGALEAEGEVRVGERRLASVAAPGHTPEHRVLVGEGLLLSGDSLLIGAVARTDYPGGDAGALYDTLQRVILPLPDETVLLPGHDYSGKETSTVGEERRTNPWLALPDREAFVKALEASQPPAIANMAALLEWNRTGRAPAAHVSAAEAVRVVEEGGAASIVDVRTAPEVESAHVPGSTWILLDTLPARVEALRAVPPPRLMLCHIGQRAEMARRFLASAGVAHVQTIVGGIDAYVAAGGRVVRGRPASDRPSAPCAAPPP